MGYFRVKENCSILASGLTRQVNVRIIDLNKDDILVEEREGYNVVFNINNLKNIFSGKFVPTRTELEGVTSDFAAVIEYIESPELLLPFEALPSVINNKQLNQTLIKWRLSKGV